MSHRLQVLIPEELDRQLRKAAQRNRVSKGEWVRRALRQSVVAARMGRTSDPVARLASLNAPTADIEQMLSEIESGRS
jgi:metal-responsive CopG/Arc/MetJ family transcriptional regulator